MRFEIIIQKLIIFSNNKRHILCKYRVKLSWVLTNFRILFYKKSTIQKETPDIYIYNWKKINIGGVPHE